MAERRQGRPRNSILCRYYVNGTCRLGAGCPFSHDLATGQPHAVCRFFLRGTCTYGQDCRFEHSRGGPGQGRKRGGAHVQGGRGANGGGGSGRRLSRDLKGLSPSLSKLRIDAPEFVPRSQQEDQPCSSHTSDAGAANQPAGRSEVCTFYARNGVCPDGGKCPLVHGEKCDFCQYNVLIPDNEDLNVEHRKSCIAEHEKEMQVAFTIAKSSVMQCGICMEVVMDKPGKVGSQFGVLSNCKHCFCLDCIRKWRKQDGFDAQNVRACPECRVQSHFVVPSPFWVDTDEEKKALIDGYKAALKKRNCRYHTQRNRECPFGNQCFYKHVNPDGTVVEGDSPRTVRRRHRRNARGRRRLSRDNIEFINLEPFASDFVTRNYLFGFDHDLDSDDELDIISLLGRDMSLDDILF